ncbi:di-heme enzyme [Methylocystis sp. MJC1]|jgi:cytochrome c peroxidase|uniref:methanobactin export MATE transporter MbnM n=1 Tax=Methylocystis sp. MJC1 TaxID=2654282 RepID=UPI0013EC7EEE|nr:methanobactin export MATE transporter MbnM [Methylocystis sp. MJC1]KAF2989909.1 Cytochrome c551 peroxidase [Methylocystis sp. MJC1]MBU6528323.1 di-heme enzyme [Methylocystis sp. MJC1]UZX11228.1 di-heme enzyme [Methylocystis sp. MJC1]
MRRGPLFAIAVLSLAAASPAAAEPAKQSGWQWELPNYVPPPRVPADNPMSEEKFQLGRRLFYDKRLSGNGTISCSSCHLQERAFTDGRALSVGSTGENTPRNAPSIVNSGWHGTLTWANPALVTLERQMTNPLLGERPIEMGVNDANKDEILARFRADSDYRKWFKEAFPEKADPITLETIVKAISAFERGVVSFNSRYDQYLQGKLKLGEAEQRGHDLYFGEKAECHHCHGSVNFNDQFVHVKTREAETPFHNTGLYNIDGKGGYPDPNRGLFDITADPDDMGKFRAPSLRNIALTGPYMHDGTVATLEDVIEIYSQGGRKIEKGRNAGEGQASPLKSGLIVKIDLTPQEKADLVAFLKTLTDDTLLTSARFSDPWKKAAASN